MYSAGPKHVSTLVFVINAIADQILSPQAIAWVDGGSRFQSAGAHHWKPINYEPRFPLWSD